MSNATKQTKFQGLSICICLQKERIMLTLKIYRYACLQAMALKA